MINLETFNTLGVPTKTKSLIEISHTNLSDYHVSDETIFLGSGSNILFRSPIVKSIAVNRLAGHKIVNSTTDTVDVEFASGSNWHETVLWTVSQNLSGMENMAFIPGTVGAAAIGNIGAYGGNQEDIFVSLKAVDPATGKELIFRKTEMEFSYRESVFKHTLAGKYFISSVTYQLSKTAHFDTSYHSRYESLSGELSKIRPPDSSHPYTIAEVATAVTNLRKNKLPDIKVLGSAGSFFKNPVVPKEVYLDLKSRLTGFQGYPPGNNRYHDESEWLDQVTEVKISAGRLLDELGWKGKKIGHVGTYEKHALIIVNYGEASGNEIFEFAEQMRSDVADNYGVSLEYEIVIV